MRCIAGRAFDRALLDDLPAGVDPCGENGEFHTCVQAGPMFSHAVAIERGETVLRDGRFAYTDFVLRSRQGIARISKSSPSPRAAGRGRRACAG